MATRFELVLYGENPVALRAAGEEALDEIDRLETRLSLYRATSEIAHLNAQAARQPVRVTPGLFALLQHAQQLHAESGGAFDITIGPLVRCWGFMDGSGRVPESGELAEARGKVGMHLVKLNPKDLTVGFAREGVMLDLGAMGKGYAIERAAGVLREAGVASALLHGGTSTVYALGHPPGADCWQVAVGQAGMQSRSIGSLSSSVLTSHGGASPQPDPAAAYPTSLATVALRDEALSVSAVWGKSFQAAGRTLGHVLDPRTGQPASAAVLAAVVLPSATETDALSTALLARGLEGHEAIARLRPGMRTLLALESDGQILLEAKGVAVTQ